MMNKFGKALKALWWILRKPILLNRVLADEDNWKTYVTDKYGLGEGIPVIGMDRLTAGDHASLEPITFLDGGSLPTDLMLLATLAGGIEDCRYFEIGTWRGESAAIMAARCVSCHTLCLTDEEMRKMRMHERTIQSHGMFSRDLDNVVQLRGDSRSFDFAALDGKFDLVFIDGDHHYDGVLSDTRNAFDHLAHQGTVVVWHDYGYHPDRVRFEVMAAILDGAGPERAGRIYHVAHTKCAVYTGQEYPSRPAEFPMLPEETFHLEITRKKL
jgi:predicted O-methyltransferase YrrM